MVEDEFLVSLVTIDLLEDVGCVIVGPAARLAAAKQLVQSDSIDAAILDIDIHGEMIWPVAKELARRGVPFLFLSAYAQLNTIPPLFAAVPCLDKPLEKDRLLHQLSVFWV